MVMIKVLDHGYIEAVEHWGSDESIIAAARIDDEIKRLEAT